MNFARVIMRITIGGLFLGHGLQKLFGWFGGGGVEGTAQMMEKLGLHPPRRNAIAAGAGEAAGGGLLLAGLATPLAAGMITATQLTAIQRVHLAKGPWITNGGYEYNVVLIAAALALAEAGPGRPSLDAALGKERRGTRWALAAAGTGALGAYAAHHLAEREKAAARSGADTGAAAGRPVAPVPSAGSNGGAAPDVEEAGGIAHEGLRA